MQIDKYEEQLERQLEELDKLQEDVDEVSKDIEPESEQEPEVVEGEGSDDEPKADDVDEPTKPEEPEAPSKDDANDTVDEPEQQLVPVARLSQVSRDKRKLEREVREQNDKIADLSSRLESMQAQAKVQGVELAEPKKGFTDDDFDSLSEEFGASHAQMLINMQKQIDGMAANNAQSTGDDPLMDAIEANEDAHGWFLVDGKNWAQVKTLWAEHEAELFRDFNTDEERIEHVVSLVKGAGPKPKADDADKAKPVEKRGPTRSLGNTPGESGKGGDLVDQYLAMGDQAISKLEALETSDPVAYERVLEGLAKRRKG